MRRFIAIVLALAVVAAGLPVASGAAAPTGADTAEAVSGTTATATGSTVAPTDNESNNSTTVTLLTYNDIQTAMAQNTTVPRMVHLVNERRAAHDNPTVVVGGGDQVSPHSLAPVSQWRLPVEVLNVLQPDVEVVGNHDLDYGFGPVANYSDASTFPWVMANIVQADSGEPIPGTEPYTVVERDGVRVGVIGLADEKILGKTAVDFDEQGYELRDYAETGQEYATQLREEENVDVVVVAGHFGVPVARDLANRTSGIDAVVVGDDEIEYPPQATNGTVIVEAEARAEHVGEVNLTVAEGEVTSWNGRLLSVTENTTKNATADRIITETRGEALLQVVGETRTELDARFASNYHDETALGNLVTDAFRWKEGSDIAITNAGGIRSNSVYGPGEVTVGDVYNMLPFGNTLVTVELTGDEVTQLLESQVVTVESETGQQYGAEPQLQVSGITYEYVPHEDVPADQRIQDVWVNGEPLAEDETYTVTVNSYMAGWEGSVLENATRVSETQDLYGTVTLEYIQAHSPVSPTDADRIRRVNHLAGQDPVTLDGAGTVTAEFALPENATELRSFYATANASTMVAAQTVEVGEETVTVTFSDHELRQLADGDAELQVYGSYNSSSVDPVYFDGLRMAGDLDVTLESPETATATATPTAAPTTAAGTTAAGTTEEAPATTAESDDGGSPGFGPGVALVALVALVAVRRR
ncbi:bifunctional metallophosphatase/5'-nucleotidase [Haloarchaeobius iranensis]|uniref:MYXO-CTERM domain-containing protein/PGF-CTERM protein n=1 Tax=Haloarchaeobius iranensis TaxID=996166 RepID=A0A1G9W4M7_9EURY|nr:bifunctional UDP-sugar hydrolase/5'-nucleotidase [Haloarchaeobius iranensis]SDM79156.1 MYXO-CTERM domain-containing protein/PGF-CTERM protein [Haloarchaeobius iranensis]